MHLNVSFAICPACRQRAASAISSCCDSTERDLGRSALPRPPWRPAHTCAEHLWIFRAARISLAYSTCSPARHQRSPNTSLCLRRGSPATSRFVLPADGHPPCIVRRPNAVSGSRLASLCLRHHRRRAGAQLATSWSLPTWTRPPHDRRPVAPPQCACRLSTSMLWASATKTLACSCGSRWLAMQVRGVFRGV